MDSYTWQEGFYAYPSNQTTAAPLSATAISAGATSRPEVSKPGQAELPKQKASPTVTVTLSTTALLIIATLAFFLWHYGLFAPRATVPEIFKTQLMRFLEEGAKTNALTEQGVSYMQLQEQVANTKAAYDLISVTWPPTLAVGCREKFERALEGWDLTIQLWRDKIDNSDEPTEPNINGFARFMAYAPDKLVVETHDYSFTVVSYRGRRFLPFDANISVLLTLAGTSFNKDRTDILHALR